MLGRRWPAVRMSSGWFDGTDLEDRSRYMSLCVDLGYLLAYPILHFYNNIDNPNFMFTAGL